jgi:hypothetical protein
MGGGEKDQRKKKGNLIQFDESIVYKIVRGASQSEELSSSVTGREATARFRFRCLKQEKTVRQTFEHDKLFKKNSMNVDGQGINLDFHGFFCNLSLFVICASTLSKLCKQRI